MNKFITLLALTAALAEAQSGKCSSLTCNPETPDKIGSGKSCVCECTATKDGACEAAGLRQNEDGSCGCEEIPAVCDIETCDERWQLDSELCECVPAAGEDPCDAIYGGAFTMEDGSDCPETEDTTSGAMHLASAAFAIAASLLF